MGQKEMAIGPKSDGTYVVEFRTAAGEALAISIPRGETAVLKYFQEPTVWAVCAGCGGKIANSVTAITGSG